MVHVLHRGVTAHKASEPSAVRIVDHVDQQHLFPASFQPVVGTGVPLHQLAKTLRRGRHSWIFSTRYLCARHSLAPIIHCRTVSRLTSISCFLAKYSAASVRPEFPVHRLQQNRYCLLFRVGTDLAVGRKSSQRVRHDFVATAFQLPQQPPHVPFRDPQFCCCLLLGGRHRSGSQEARRRSQ